MKFLAIEPFFFCDQYWPATPEAPFAFEYPKGFGPNVKWYPLDKDADEVLQAVQETIRGWGSNVICHRIPRNIKVPPIYTLPIPEVVEPDVVHPALIDRARGAADPEQFSMSEVQANMKPQVPKQHQRPSDSEPRKG